MPYRNRIRLPFYLSQAQFPVDRNVFRRADGSSKVLSAIVRQTYVGKTDDLPEEWHRKLVIALAHEDITIQDTRLLTDVVLDGDYGIDWKDFMNHPTAQSKFTVQVTPFNATGNNCQSCEEITQLNLVDDTTDAIFAEGTTGQYPNSVLANDDICCLPFTVELVSSNTTYFNAVAIDQDGIITYTVKDSVPNISDLLIATYRVTCPNGGFDEADVYGNISGTSTVCIPASNLRIEYPLPGGTSATAIWTNTSGQNYDWYLYLSSDLVMPVQSGGVSTPVVEMIGLTSGVSYTFVVIGNCGGGSFSTPVSVIFAPVARNPVTCGNFTVTYIPSMSEGMQSASYLDCDGNAQTIFFLGAGAEDRCMLMNEEVPTFFAASTPDIIVNYAGTC